MLDGGDGEDVVIGGSSEHALEGERLGLDGEGAEFSIQAVTASFLPGTGILWVFGDVLDNNITVNRNAAGDLLVNGGAVAIVGGLSTLANTELISAGQSAPTRRSRRSR